MTINLTLDVLFPSLQYLQFPLSIVEVDSNHLSFILASILFGVGDFRTELKLFLEYIIVSLAFSLSVIIIFLNI